MAYTSVALLMCNVHRNTFSVLLPQMSAQLGLSPSQVGSIQAGSLAAYLLGQLPSGRLADKLSGTSVLVAGLLVWSLATAATALPCLGAASAAAPGGAAALLLAARAAMGLASAAAMPSVTAISAQMVPAAGRASAVAGAYAAFNLGGVLGLALLPLLALAVGLPGAFLLSGAAGVAWAAYGAAALPRRRAPEGGAGPAAAKQQQQKQQRRRGAWPRPPRLAPGGWRQLGVLCLSHGVMGYTFFILQNWIPSYLAAVGGPGTSLAATGWLSSIPWLAAAAAGPLVGRGADRLVRSGWSTLSVRRLCQSACFLGCAASLAPLAAAASPGLPLAVGCLTASLAFYSCSHSGFHAHLQDVSGENAGVVYGLTNSASIAVGIAGNLLTGAVVEASGGSYAAVFVAAAALNVAAAAAFAALSSGARVELL